MVPVVALFLPWFSVRVPPETLPEAGFVVDYELQPVDPLRGLPEVQVRHEYGAGPPWIGSSGSPSYSWAIHALPSSRPASGRFVVLPP